MASSGTGELSPGAGVEVPPLSAAGAVTVTAGCGASPAQPERASASDAQPVAAKRRRRRMFIASRYPRGPAAQPGWQGFEYPSGRMSVPPAAGRGVGCRT